MAKLTAEELAKLHTDWESSDVGRLLVHIAALEAELETAESEYECTRTDLAASEAERETFERLVNIDARELERLREALRQYGHHKRRCSSILWVNSVDGAEPCDCGLSQALAQKKAS